MQMIAQVAYTKAQRSNRTFMELKFSILIQISRHNKVLIAPLWN